MKVLLLMSIISSLEALHCDKEFNFVDSVYEKGYDITCQGLTDSYISLLESISVENEISLKMENCTLKKVSAKLFKNVRNIKHLTIENSTFAVAETASAFEILNELEELSIINTGFKVNKHSFAKLNNLKRLHLDNNQLKIMEKDAFADLSHLTTLEVTNNNLSDISNVPLCDFNNLKVLNFSRNSLRTLSQVFYCETPEPPLTLDLNDAPQSINTGQSVMSSSVSSTELYKIDFSYNKIEDINTSFAFLRSLRVVKLQGNKLSKITNSYFTFLEYLEELQMCDNNIDAIEEEVFKDKHYLEKVDLSKNRIKHFNFAFMGTLKYLHLGDNELDIQSLSTINATNQLNILLLNDNNIKKIKANTFSKYSLLSQLNLANNNINLEDLSFSGLMNLTKLDISNNSIEFMPRRLFKDFSNLRILDLSQNKLTAIKYNDTFDSLINLKVLNLSRNLLTDLNYQILREMKNLNVLDISFNKLHRIDYDVIMSNLPSLNLLSIKSNDLSCALLAKIIGYLKTKGVSYTVQNKLNNDKVNVGGIICGNESTERNNIVPESNIMFNLVLALIVVLVTVVLSIITFKVYIYLKRRKYKADEFELIEE